MGLLTGSASFVRFSVVGEVPERTWDFIAERVRMFSFKDIDESHEENSLGWVSVDNMFDAEFNFASYASGNYVTLSLRFDERKISKAILKKLVQKEENIIKRERQIPRISRKLRGEIRERITAELLYKSIPLPSVYDVVWNLSDSTLLFFSTNRKAQALLEDFFKKTFELSLIQQVPFLTAQHLLNKDAHHLLERLSSTVFVDSMAINR